MSFTSTVKNELSKLDINKVEAITELSAFLRNNALINNNVIKITTENSSIARHIFNSIKNLYHIIPKIIVRRGYNYNKNYVYILELTDSGIIKNDLGLNSNMPSEYLNSDDNLIRMYLRGVFLACGSINDPKKSRYHLEFIVDNLEYAKFIESSLNMYDLNSKVLKRESKYMIYIKEAEKIGDFLRMVNAIGALLYFEDIRIYRDHKNMTNRLNNCEQANVDKIIETATNQVNDIEKINTIGGIDLLDDKTKTAAMYRMKYKEASLLELSQIISLETNIPITKSGLYHRFKKIKDLASKIGKGE